MKSKKHAKHQFKTTSVTIRLEQYAFIKKHGLNFSSIVQEALNKLIKEGEA